MVRGDEDISAFCKQVYENKRRATDIAEDAQVSATKFMLPRLQVLHKIDGLNMSKVL
jgi:hypothetical protein